MARSEATVRVRVGGIWEQRVLRHGYFRMKDGTQHHGYHVLARGEKHPVNQVSDGMWEVVDPEEHVDPGATRRSES